MRVGEFQRSASSTHCVGFVHWVIKSSKTRVCVLLLLSLALGFWIRAQGWHWPAVRFVETHLKVDHLYRNIKSVFSAPPLPKVYIDVKFKHVEKLEAKRTEALRDGWLRTTDDDFVPATLTYEDDSTPVKIRLKGDRTLHLQGDKWSFRVKVQGDQRLFGMRTFSLHHPRTRLYLHEWSFLENVRREGILAVRYQFVRVVFNGADKGIYALEEHFSKELLEAHGRREGVIVSFEERPSIHMDTFTRGWNWDEWDVTTRLSAVASQEIRTFSTGRIERDPSLRAQRDEAVELLRAFQEGRRKPSEVFDAEIMGRYMALIDLWQAEHAIMWHNTRYYYNPITARLEPIGFDAMALWEDRDLSLITSPLQDYFVNRPLRDPEIASIYLRELDRVSTQEYLDGLRSSLGPQFRRWQSALRREFFFEPKLEPPWERLARRQKFIRTALSPKKRVIASAIRMPIEATTTADAAAYCVDIRSISLLPVEIVGFCLNGGLLIPAASVWPKRQCNGIWENSDGSVSIAPSSIAETLILATFYVPVQSTADGGLSTQPVAIQVATRFPGQSDYRLTSVRMAPPRSEHGSAPLLPTVEEAMRRHPFLKKSVSGDTLLIPSGIWDVTGDLLLPQSVALEVEPGTTLRFEPQAVLYATAPVHLRGAVGREIVLEPLAAHWGGVVVVDAGVNSVWQDVAIRHTSGIQRGGWMLTGGVTFYKSDTEMTRVSFVGNRGEDALNVIHAKILLKDCKFEKCNSDAFDGDSVRGTVQNCEFTDIGADGIDVSGSEVTIDHSMFDQIGDKAISAGERSTVQVRSISVSQSRFGVVSKDSSKVSVERSTFRQVQYGLAAFVKKPEFGPAHLEAQEIRMTQVARPSLLQTGSTMTIDGQNQAAEELDVESLYRTSAIDDRKNGEV